MKVTVCQLRNEPEFLNLDWKGLVKHVKNNKSELIVLPEMPFYPWVAWTKYYDPKVWKQSVDIHNQWMFRLNELAPAIIIGTRPIVGKETNHNQGFVLQQKTGYQELHTKYYLPDEELFWEATWYKRGELDFTPKQASNINIGMAICTEIWYTEHARKYAKSGVHIVASPRATVISSADKWIAGGRACAVMSGAFNLSSNRGSVDINGMHWAGQGWIIEPDGEVIGLTSEEDPFLTLDIDLQSAEFAKKTYPRYVLE